MGQEIDLVSVFLVQQSLLKPEALAYFFDQIAKGLLILAFQLNQMMAGFLAQYVLPVPLVQLLKHWHSTKLAIASYEYGDIIGN